MKWIDTEIFGHRVKIAFDENSIHIYDAYPVKDDLKKKGYRWNPNDKSWFLNSLDASKEILELKRKDQPEKKIITFDLSPPATKNEDGLPGSYSVAELRDYLDEIIRRNIKRKVWIRGVVASKVKDYQWASYFDLRDEDEQKPLFFRCELRIQEKVFIENKLKELNVSENLERDLPVFFQVEISLSLRSSVDIRLRIVDILPEYTKAKLRSQLDITLDKLKEEGILENQKKLLLPKIVSNLGLITSEKGTSVKDILAGLNPYQKKYSFCFIDSRMEGRDAVNSIKRSINYFKTHQKKLSIDGILIARGGGSEQSLSVFNDLSLCRAVCKLKIPILTAIGHEKDLSAIELCSHLTPIPATPSGLGKYLYSRYVSLKDELIHKGELLIRYLTNFNTQERGRISSLCNRLTLLFTRIYQHEKKYLYSMVNRFIKSAEFKIILAHKDIKGVLIRFDFDQLLKRNMKNRQLIGQTGSFLLEQCYKTSVYAKNDLTGKINLIKSNHPESVLKKGFSLTFSLENKVIKSKKEFDQQERVKIQFYDGYSGIVKEESKDE